MTPDDIPTSVTQLTYRTAQALGDAGIPVLSQNQTAVLLAHYWPAIEAHFRDLLADEIGATSQRLLDDIPESKRSPRDWDQHEEWLEAASSIRRPTDPAAVVPARTGGE
jgi:hypothetical protein